MHHVIKHLLFLFFKEKKLLHFNFMRLVHDLFYLGKKNTRDITSLPLRLLRKCSQLSQHSYPFFLKVVLSVVQSTRALLCHQPLEKVEVFTTDGW